MKKRTLLLFAILIASAFSFSQSDSIKREFGLRFTGLSNYGGIYKYHLKENKYRRIRFAAADLSFQKVFGDFVPNDNFYSNAYLSAAFGAEKRFEINEKFSFVRGREIIVSASHSYNNTPFSTTALGIGYGFVLGVNYQVSENFLINLETIPAISTSVSYNRPMNNYDLKANIGLNTNLLAISFLYKFKSHKFSLKNKRKPRK